MTDERAAVSIDRQAEPHVVIVRLPTTPNAEATRTMIDDQFQSGFFRFAIDLEHAEYIASSTLGTIVAIINDLRKRECRSVIGVALIWKDQRIDSLFSVTGLWKLLGTRESGCVVLHARTLGDALVMLRGHDPDDPPRSRARVQRPQSPPGLHSVDRIDPNEPEDS